MTNIKTGIAAGHVAAHRAVQQFINRTAFVLFIVFTAAYAVSAPSAVAQSFRFSTIKIEGNQRVDAATIISYAGITKGKAISGAALNDAYQRIINSGLFESVNIVPRGGSLIIKVVEYPTINRINFEGNKRLKDADLQKIIQSQTRHVYNPSTAETDVAAITDAYSQSGRYLATVSPKIIHRSDNRVDLVFEIAEGKVVEIERLSFVGNRKYSDRRLRRVLETKQAGLLRFIISKDTFIADRIEFDKQVLTDFYQSRGFVDFHVLSVNSEIARGREGFFITFSVQEGQQFKFGEVTVESDIAEVDADEFVAAIKIKPGKTYSPSVVENTIARLERLAIQKSLNFVRVEPRITRNDRDLTLDIEFLLTRGPRVFVERIDIEGNATTLDRVVRRQFDVVEGDPFNPRQIRESAERIRALGFFKTADVNASEGSAPDQVVVDVNVEEAPTGSLNFGASYGTSDGVGLTLGFEEKNFLGRGQTVALSFNTTSSNAALSASFFEPAFLGRDLGFFFSGSYKTSDNSNAKYNTRVTSFKSGLRFPISENGRLDVHYGLSKTEIFGVAAAPAASPILIADETAGPYITSSIGYNYSFDTRGKGLNPDAGIVLRFNQDFAGIGGDSRYLKTTALFGAETKVFNGDVTLRAVLEAGGIATLGGGNTHITDRFFLNSGKLRGYQPNGIGPRDLGTTNKDALGGNLFAVARFEAEFPFGLPEEYGLSGGVFYDIGSVWSLDNTAGVLPVDDGFHLRSSIGFSIFWTTAIGPLRLNFSRALQKQTYDLEQSFELTIQTKF